MVQHHRSIVLAARPPSGAARYVVGRDREGHWLALETQGRGGGIFVSREAALAYAGFETGHDPHGVSESPDPIAFDLAAACRAGRSDAVTKPDAWAAAPRGAVSARP
jgi:hypothetical protein